MRYLDLILDDPTMTTMPTKAETTGVRVGLRTNEQTPPDPAVVDRAVAMLARHPRPWQAIPFLTVIDVPRVQQGCRSCGDPVEVDALRLVVRCRSCAEAASLALLDVTRPPRSGW